MHCGRPVRFVETTNFSAALIICCWFLDGEPRGTLWSIPNSSMRESEQPMTDPHEGAAAQGVKAAGAMIRTCG
jgi:hypothetical protein